ncbi:unnamed protein product, partial [Ixodes pacificus]
MPREPLNHHPLRQRHKGFPPKVEMRTPALLPKLREPPCCEPNVSCRSVLLQAFAHRAPPPGIRRRRAKISGAADLSNRTRFSEKGRSLAAVRFSCAVFAQNSAFFRKCVP